MPAWMLSLVPKLLGLNFAKLKPLLPYAIAFAAAWFIQSYRLGEKQVKAQLEAKDDYIATQDIKIKTAEGLVAIRDSAIERLDAEDKKAKARVSELEGRVSEMAARVPMDKTTIIDKTKDQVDDIISKDESYAWLRYSYPKRMLDDTNRAIRESKEYGLSAPTLAGRAADRADP